METTTFRTPHGTEHEGLFLTWAEVEAILGEQHDGNPWQDQKIITHIRAAYPQTRWLHDGHHLGHIDETGWYIYAEDSK